MGEKKAGEQGVHRRVKQPTRPTGKRYNSVDDMMRSMKRQAFFNKAAYIFYPIAWLHYYGAAALIVFLAWSMENFSGRYLDYTDRINEN